MPAVPLVFIEEIIAGGVKVGELIKTIGRVIDIERQGITLLTISMARFEITVRVYDEPPGFLDYISKNVTIGDYVLVIGYIKELENIVYILAKGLKKIDKNAYQYYITRHKLNELRERSL